MVQCTGSSQPTVIMLIFEPRTPITRPIRLLGTLMVMLQGECMHVGKKEGMDVRTCK